MMGLKRGLRNACLVGVLCGGLATYPLAAQDNPIEDGQKIYWQSDNWQVVANELKHDRFNFCELSHKRQAPNSLRFFKGGSEVGYLQFREQDWQANGRSPYDVRWVFDGRKFKGSVIGRGIYSGRTSDAEFVESFKKASQLAIVHGDDLVANISLAGSFRAHRKLTECAAQWPKSFVPVAPEPPPPRTMAPMVPRPTGEKPIPLNPGEWLKLSDYKADWLRADYEGTVSFTLNVSSDGAVTSCALRGGSAPQEVKAATCQLVQQRARFKPAVDNEQKPIPGVYKGSANWSLPK